MEAARGVELGLKRVCIAQTLAKFGETQSGRVLAERNRKTRLDQRIQQCRAPRQLVTELGRERQDTSYKVKEPWPGLKQREHLDPGGQRAKEGREARKSLIRVTGVGECAEQFRRQPCQQFACTL